MLICWPIYDIVLLCSAFEPVKQFFLSDSFGLDIVTVSFYHSYIIRYTASSSILKTSEKGTSEMKQPTRIWLLTQVHC
jgi:hypothetical protein